jgi:hypothetical protein
MESVMEWMDGWMDGEEAVIDVGTRRRKDEK